MKLAPKITVLWLVIKNYIVDTIKNIGKRPDYSNETEEEWLDRIDRETW